MSTPDAEDANQTDPDLETDYADLDMAEQKDKSSSRDGSPSQPASADKKPSNAKDPLRPRRKKARRACFACQRAHLTCGDERPCHRCIKRGLQDQCHDGVRKKAKYLHDAPNEALMPGVGGHYPPHMNGLHQRPSVTVPASTPMTDAGSVQSASTYYPQGQTPNYSVYGQGNAPSQMPPPMSDGSVMGSFSSQATPISPTFNHRGSQSSPVQNIHGIPQAAQSNVAQMSQPGGPLFDPSDPALFNFDISSLNFGNHYGAMEFGMLGQMASGAAETPPENSMMNSMNQVQTFNTPMTASTNFSDSPNQVPNMLFSQSDWQNSHRQNSSGHLIQNVDPSQRHDSVDTAPHAFAIAAGPPSLATESPASNPPDFAATSYDNAPTSPAFFATANGQSQPQQKSPQQKQAHGRPSSHQHHLPRPKIKLEDMEVLFNPGKRSLDSSTIYNNVNQPYEYTQHFHKLTAFLRKRLPSAKVQRIAKSLAETRPSLISCVSRLDRDDLIMNEKQLQRQLPEYENYMSMNGTPSLLCRRTGEVVLASKEFCMLTGWRKDVLLGKEPNLNVNTGGDSGNPSSGISTGRGGVNTPRQPNPESDGNAGLQPVFLAELLDDDALLQFYEDYASLAFNDPRGSKIRRCKLIKYRIKDSNSSLDDLGKSTMEDKVTGRIKKEHRHHNSRLGHSISGEAGMTALGADEGMVDCMFTWTVKRDTFEMPMLLVMNFLPII